MDVQQSAWLKKHRLTVCPPGPYVTTWFPRLCHRHRTNSEPSLREMVALHSQSAAAAMNVDSKATSGKFRKLEREADRLLEEAG